MENDEHSEGQDHTINDGVHLDLVEEDHMKIPSAFSCVAIVITTVT